MAKQAFSRETDANGAILRLRCIAQRKPMPDGKRTLCVDGKFLTRFFYFGARAPMRFIHRSKRRSRNAS